MTTKEFAKILQDKLTSEYGVELSVASNQQIYRSLALICRQMMSENHKKFQSKAIGTGTKQVYYLCMEFLMGRSLKTSLLNLGLDEVAKKALSDADISIDSIFEEEPDAGLGNGGLGRLAACYLDGMATTGICGTGYSILYEYGIFKQKIVDGWQQERADNWLPGGQVWLKSHPDQAVEVRFDGEIHENWDNGFHYIQHTNYNSVMAVPSDMYVQGYDGKGVAKLRLWQAKAPDFDMSSFSLGNYNTAMSKNANAELISKVLYPNDNHVEGKILRLRQQYFLSAASIGDIVQNHLSSYATLENLPDKVAIQLNDTHPTLAIPEMMRILLDECGFDWDKAFTDYIYNNLGGDALYEVWKYRGWTEDEIRPMKITEEVRAEGKKMIEAGDDYDVFDKFLNREYFKFRHSHDKRIEWETRIMGYVYQHAGPDALWTTMASVTPHYWQHMIDVTLNGTFKDAVLEQIGGLETHGEPLEIMEDDEKVVVWMRPCGSGQFLVEQGVYEAPQSCARCKACPQTWNLDNFPVYCVHAPQQEILSIKPVSYTHLTLPTNSRV